MELQELILQNLLTQMARADKPRTKKTISNICLNGLN